MRILENYTQKVVSALKWIPFKKLFLLFLFGCVVLAVLILGTEVIERVTRPIGPLFPESQYQVMTSGNVLAQQNRAIHLAAVTYTLPAYILLVEVNTAHQ